MAKSNPTIQQTDRRISKLARSATKAAYDNAIASGHSVLVVKNGEIRCVSGDGRFSVVKKSDPDVPMKKGTVIQIK